MTFGISEEQGIHTLKNSDGFCDPVKKSTGRVPRERGGLFCERRVKRRERVRTGGARRLLFALNRFVRKATLPLLEIPSHVPFLLRSLGAITPGWSFHSCAFADALRKPFRTR